MEAHITRVSSIIDGIRGLYMSKRTYSKELEEQLITWERGWLNWNGTVNPEILETSPKFKMAIEKLLKYGQKHTTLLRFVDFTGVVLGLHRGATDDFDSHAKRLDNRIIRSSTRLADYDSGEMSEYYSDKILTLDQVIDTLSIELPERIECDDDVYVRTANGYIREDLKDNRDVKRGLYMLSIPMNFTFKCNLTEFAHIYRERGAHSHAAPELKEMIELIMDQIEAAIPGVTREYLLGIIN